MKVYRWAVVGLVSVLLVAAVFRSVYSIRAAVPVMADIATLPVIVIDPGHGGMDGGAVGADGIVEKDINLAICLVMRDIFVASGFEVILTRDTDVSIHDEGVTGTRKQKTSDLRNRLAIVQEHPGAVFISVHQNKFGDSRSWGTQVFYGPNNASSKALAELLQQRFVSNLQPGNKRLCKQAGKNLYLMYNADCPAVLVECGFLSNTEEARRLLDPDYQAQIAFTTFSSVMQFLNLDVPAAPIREEPGEHSDTGP